MFSLYLSLSAGTKRSRYDLFRSQSEAEPGCRTWEESLGMPTGIFTARGETQSPGAELGSKLGRFPPRVLPHNLTELSILLFVVSIASNARAMVHREDGKATATSGPA